MRFLGTAILPLIAALAALAVASPLTTELDISATASFPTTNPFGNVVNGEKNTMSLEVENRSGVNVTLKSAGGSIHDPETGKFFKNTTTLSYGVTLIAGAKTVLPYTFYSEYKPREVQLKLWVDYDSGAPEGLQRTVAYDSVVTIVEPPASLFDIPLLFSLAVMLSLLGGAGYFIYQNFVPKTKKRKVRKTSVSKTEISAPVGPVTASSKAYDEDWIPKHHLQSKKKVKADGAAVSSGDESGAEKRRAKKAA